MEDQIEDLRQRLEAVEAALKLSEEPMTIQQTAKFLSLSVPTIYSKVAKGEIPYLKATRKLYFLRSDLMHYLKANRKAAPVKYIRSSGSLPSVDPLDDENSEIHKIGREIAEMSDKEFEANCKAFEKMIKRSKGNDR